MENKRKIIPFSFWPMSWGMTGNTRKIAEAEYYYSGYELDRQLATILSDSHADFEKALLKVDLKYSKIDEYTYDSKLAQLSLKDESEKKIAALEVDLKHEKITQLEFEKKKADVLKEPWVSMPKISWDPKNSNGTYFELDYNDYFISFLRKNEYVGTDEDIINKWLNDVCISVIEEINDLDAEFITPSRREADPSHQ